jgi:hypothetical protein
VYYTPDGSTNRVAGYGIVKRTFNTIRDCKDWAESQLSSKERTRA